MKVVTWHWLSDQKAANADEHVVRAMTDINGAISRIVWPPGSDRFTIHAEPGRQRGKGNGVRPICGAFVANLKKYPGWQTEYPIELSPTERKPGPIDGVRRTPSGLIAVEWETGNVSSSHRSLNKLAYGLQTGCIAAGFLIAPSRAMYRYLTDRISNVQELYPYFGFWRDCVKDHGHCAVIEVEHDDTSIDVPRIAKGTDGRALF